MTLNDTKRPKRLPLHSAVHIVKAGGAWTSDIRDISATGVLIDRPERFTPVVGDTCVLDMIFGDDLSLHVEAMVARLSQQEVGFAFSRIPPEKEIPLWELLGAAADEMEPYRE